MYKACQHTRRLVEVAGIFHRIFRRRDERSTGSVLASDPGYHVSSPEARAAPDKNSTRRSTVFPAPKSSSVVSPVLEKTGHALWVATPYRYRQRRPGASPFVTR